MEDSKLRKAIGSVRSRVKKRREQRQVGRTVRRGERIERRGERQMKRVNRAKSALSGTRGEVRSGLKQRVLSRLRMRGEDAKLKARTGRSMRTDPMSYVHGYKKPKTRVERKREKGGSMGTYRTPRP